MQREIMNTSETATDAKVKFIRSQNKYDTLALLLNSRKAIEKLLLQVETQEQEIKRLKEETNFYKTQMEKLVTNNLQTSESACAEDMVCEESVAPLKKRKRNEMEIPVMKSTPKECREEEMPSMIEQPTTQYFDFLSDAVPMVEEKPALQETSTSAPSEVDKKSANRNRAIEELLKTEESYCVSLTKMEAFANDCKNELSDEEWFSVFANISEVASLNKGLLKTIQTRIESQDVVIGDLFSKSNYDFVETYLKYVKNSAFCLANTIMLQRKYPNFDVLCKKFTEANKQIPDAFLKMPYQRIPRYGLLLSAILQNTESSNPDMELLPIAIQYIKEKADEINIATPDASNSNQIISIENSIIGDFEPLLKPNCKFVAQGDVRATNEKFYSLRSKALPKWRRSEKIFHWVLMDDSLVWLLPESGKFKYLGAVPRGDINANMMDSKISVQIQNESWDVTLLDEKEELTRAFWFIPAKETKLEPGSAATNSTN